MYLSRQLKHPKTLLVITLTLLLTPLATQIQKNSNTFKIKSKTTTPSSTQTVINPPSAKSAQTTTQHYTIQPNDTLSGIFKDQHINQKTLQQLLHSDINVLALDKLYPGQKLTFIYQKNQLNRFIIRLSLDKEVIYQYQDHDHFNFQEKDIPGTYRRQSITGNIHHNFSTSAITAGLNQQEIQFITDLLRNKINFSRQVQPNDRFEILIDRQFIDNQYTGKSRLEMVRLFNGNNIVEAYLFHNTYYDIDGKNIENTLQRLPLKKHYRISSPFNLRRKHPMTGAIHPHNGTDFAIPVGTPVLSTGDGIVTRVRHHKYAGLYIEIDHGNNFTTRYLHLSKALVTRGEHVSRGKQIALSGNTGRTTGPHLHFELRRKGSAINAMTAALPAGVPIKRSNLAAYHQQIEAYHLYMKHGTLNKSNEKNTRAVVNTPPKTNQNAATNNAEK